MATWSIAGKGVVHADAIHVLALKLQKQIGIDVIANSQASFFATFEFVRFLLFIEEELSVAQVWVP